MNKVIEIDALKKQIIEMQKMYLQLLNKLDQIKIKLTSNEKVSKKEIIDIIDSN